MSAASPPAPGCRRSGCGVELQALAGVGEGSAGSPIEADLTVRRILDLLAQRLLDQRDAAVEQCQRPDVLERHLRVGVTGLTAMTGLPRLISAIQARYPRVIIEPHLDSSIARLAEASCDVGRIFQTA